METLKISLKNCYGIGSFDYLFNFKVGEKKPKQRAYAIYAPNGFMKTSFSKTLDDISQNRQPKEERYGRVIPPFLIELMGRKSKALLLFKNRWTTIY